MKKWLSIIPLAIASVTLAGCGGSSTSADVTTMTDASSAPFDRAFIDAMVPHHRSAIEMAKEAQSEGLSSPALKAIAVDIISSQQTEIDQMLAFRKDWYGSTNLDPNAGEQLGMSMSEMGMSHGASDMMDSGGTVDQTFASLMSDHHQGAIAMARLALTRAQHAEIKTLARNIIAAQERELKIMRPLAKETGDHTMTGMSTG